jgi:hypothetical protein
MLTIHKISGVAPRRVIRRSPSLVITAVTFLLWALTSAAPAAQQEPHGSVAGRVFDQTGQPLPDASIELVSATSTLRTASNLDGTFRFDGVPAGSAELTLRRINFTVVKRHVTVSADRPSIVGDLTLWLSLTADVAVTAPSTFRNLADIPNPTESLVGIASSASQGAVTAAQLETRPIMRAGEVLETVPGMIVSQHSGEGKANQYYVRGFNLDHGTDFSTMVAGTPVNMPTGAHAHGYSDLGFVIPELVSGVQFKKGPYFADEGDFSAAGAANINYINRLERPMVTVDAGQGGWSRVLGAASPRVGAGNLLAAIELNHNDGPWLRPDDYRKANGVLRYSLGDNRNGLSITGMGYWADWSSSDQVPDRAVASGLIPRFGFLDGSDGGTLERESLAAEFQRSIGSSSLRATAFVLRNRVDLFSNFTYFLDDPTSGDQFEQTEQRTVAGGRLTFRRLGRIFNRHTESAVGLQVRRDWLDPVGLYHTASRRRLSTTRQDRVGQTMTGVYAQSEIDWTRTLRTMAGLRADVYQFSVAANDRVNSGAGVAGLVSPKLTAVFGPWRGTEFYANAGMGFHSNDARGAVINVDPSTREAVDPVTPLVRARGAELGVRTVRVRGLQSTASLWYLGLASELVFVGDAGTTAASRPSRRVGLEWTNYWRVNSWMTTDADLSISRAAFADDEVGGIKVPGALARVLSGGVTIEPRGMLFGGVRVRHFGPRPLVKDGNVQSKSTTLWNGEIDSRLSRTTRVVLELFNIFDAKVSDIDYFYTSRLQGESLDGVDDVHTHPALPRSVRVALRVSF